MNTSRTRAAIAKARGTRRHRTAREAVDADPAGEQRRHQVAHGPLPRAAHHAQRHQHAVHHRQRAALDPSGARRRARPEGQEPGEQDGHRLRHLRLLQVAGDHREASQSAVDRVLARAVAERTDEQAGQRRPRVRPVPRAHGGDGHAAGGAILPIGSLRPTGRSSPNGRLPSSEVSGGKKRPSPSCQCSLMYFFSTTAASCRVPYGVCWFRATHGERQPEPELGAARELRLRVHARGLVRAHGREERLRDLVLHRSGITGGETDVNGTRERAPGSGSAASSSA